MAVILKCPVCGGKFKYDVSVGWPDFCQIKECGADINNRRADDEICVPAFLSQKSKNNDKVARDIMDGSVQRAEMAAAMAGTSVDESSATFFANEVLPHIVHAMEVMVAADKAPSLANVKDFAQKEMKGVVDVVVPEVKKVSSWCCK